MSRQQASDFAKQIANDFNPIHDIDAKRFCVPGDLLFSLVLNHYGLDQHMRFTFSGMVGDNIQLIFPRSDTGEITIRGDNGKEYLRIERSGDRTHDAHLINKLVRVYVAFSGQAFPHILVPLMQQHEVMINPDRPLIIYESMELNLDKLEILNPELSLTGSSLTPKGKRGEVQLNFVVKDGAEIVGKGTKKMVLSGLRPFDEQHMQQVVSTYNQRMAAHGI